MVKPCIWTENLKSGQKETLWFGYKLNIGIYN